MLKQTIKLSIQSTSIIGRVGQLVIDLEEVGVDPPSMSSPVCMACVPASYVDLECKHLFESADVAAAGAQGCSCDSLVYVYLRREQDGVHCLSNLTKIKNNIGNVYSSHCVHIHHVYSSTSNVEN